MGWGDCGTDSNGRPIGYLHGATCDHEGCDAEIDRGLGNACGGMHGENGPDCEGYFCAEHLQYVDIFGEEPLMLCEKCSEAAGGDQ